MLKDVSTTLTNQVNLSGAIYYYMGIALMILGALGWIIKHVHGMDSRMRKIEYALYNDGKTGLINKVDTLVENQSEIKADVKVLFDRDERD